jgi:hypothetical protein
MPGVYVGSSGLALPDAVPQIMGRIATGSVTSAHVNFTQGSTDTVAVLLGADMTATQAEPVQVFAHLVGNAGEIFYWDSQSTGEGNGVTFSWRGYYPLEHNDTIDAYVTAASGIIMGIVLWGCLVPFK